MKTLERLLVLIALATTVWLTTGAQNAAATQNIESGVNVTHSKEWYDQFEYDWPINTTTHTSKITEKATDPDQIIALLRFIYMDKRIPGIHYAGYGTSTSNLTTRVRQVYYGGIEGGWDIPYNTSNDRYTDYVTYKPEAEGYTVLLVAVKDNFTMTGRTADLFYDMNYDKLKEIINYSVEYVQLLTDGMRLNEGVTNNADYYPGTLFTLENASGLNRFFFLSKGQARDQYHADRGDAEINAPFGRMFEQFSPTDGTEGSEITNYYEALKTGRSYPIQHDCNSVLLAEHYFSMVGKDATGEGTHQDVSGLQFFIPDQRLTYWQDKRNVWDYYYTSYYSYHFRVTEASFDGRTMNYDKGLFLVSPKNLDGSYIYYNQYYYGPLNGDINDAYTSYRAQNIESFTGNAHGGGYAEYAYYNLEKFAPKTQWYRIELTATTTQEDNPDKWGEHTYRTDLKWESSADALSLEPLEQIYWVYEIVNGNEVLISPEDGLVDVREWTVTNSDALYTQQYPSGRKRTFVVKGRPVIATYQPVRSNTDDAIIPGYDKRERLSLSIGTDYYSKWNAQGEYNQYCNAVKIENGTGNSVTTGYIKRETVFNAYRLCLDEAGNEDTKLFAVMKFTNDWQTTTATNGYLKIGTDVYKMRIAFSVTYSDQAGEVPSGKTKTTSGYLYAKSASDNEVFFGENGVELLDIFQASTRENKHPDGYTYYVQFTSSEPFPIDVLDENGNVQYVEDAQGDFWYNETTQKYEKIIEGESYTQRFSVKTEMQTEVQSNRELIPVFKCQYSLHNEGYTQTQVNADNDNNMSNLLAPHMAYSYPDGAVTTDLNKITVTLQTNSTSEIHQYEILRNPQGSGENNNKVIARAQASSTGDNYLITQNDKNNNAVEKGTYSAGNYDFADEAILEPELGAQSVAYVPVISTRPKDEARLTKGDYNTYGADIQHVGIPSLELGTIEAEQSTYTWRIGEDVYRYYTLHIPVTGTLPDGAKYSPFYWRSWRELSGDLDNIIGEEYPEGLVRNYAGGYLYEQTLPDGHLSITSGTMERNYGTLTNYGGKTREVKDASGIFGAKSGIELDLNYKVRMYYLVNSVSSRAPRRAGNGEQVSREGQYYVVDYNIPYKITSDHVITGVNGIASSPDVAGVTYYNTMGLPSTTPWSGVNIVVTRYTDGSTTTAKVVR